MQAWLAPEQLIIEFGLLPLLARVQSALRHRRGESTRHHAFFISCRAATLAVATDGDGEAQTGMRKSTCTYDTSKSESDVNANRAEERDDPESAEDTRDGRDCELLDWHFGFRKTVTSGKD